MRSWPKGRPSGRCPRCGPRLIRSTSFFAASARALSEPLDERVQRAAARACRPSRARRSRCRGRPVAHPRSSSRESGPMPRAAGSSGSGFAAGADSAFFASAGRGAVLGDGAERRQSTSCNQGPFHEFPQVRGARNGRPFTIRTPASGRSFAAAESTPAFPRCFRPESAQALVARKAAGSRLCFRISRDSWPRSMSSARAAAATFPRASVEPQLQEPALERELGVVERGALGHAAASAAGSGVSRFASSMLAVAEVRGDRLEQLELRPPSVPDARVSDVDRADRAAGPLNRAARSPRGGWPSTTGRPLGRRAVEQALDRFRGRRRLPNRRETPPRATTGSFPAARRAPGEDVERGLPRRVARRWRHAGAGRLRADAARTVSGLRRPPAA